MGTYTNKSGLAFRNAILGEDHLLGHCIVVVLAFLDQRPAVEQLHVQVTKEPVAGLQISPLRETNLKVEPEICLALLRLAIN